ncbi:hypothetical protein DYBT9275_00332 [Dyadobacter sp. CECT 9275]|uniref:Beta-lactamase-inhibitor-like PepSY-like domain-containing protein n=1 Tax=Dyadobacter helix TaxID=2822344 RepID=A0A916J787_9BACT|nr:hypothetical protein [Dyadobacter sp. CECT 9275]CAG4989640.1 hypothetical protein DYBT9275_00332 [Dyadobacter sp. CECT 9275]
MKKPIIAVLTACLLSAINLNGASVAEPVLSVYTSQEKVAIKPEDLPEAVKETLGSNAYLGWEVTAAFLITKQDNSQYYEIAAKKGTETATINLDKYGKKVE